MIKYIGLPYSIYDCWNLIKHYYKNELNILLPDYTYLNSDDINSIEKATDKNKTKWIKLEKPEKDCVIIFNLANHPIHIGLCIDDNRMLHTLRGHDSVIEKFTSIKWKKRIEGYYKWPSM